MADVEQSAYKEKGVPVKQVCRLRSDLQKLKGSCGVLKGPGWAQRFCSLVLLPTETGLILCCRNWTVEVLWTFSQRTSGPIRGAVQIQTPRGLYLDIEKYLLYLDILRCSFS